MTRYFHVAAANELQCDLDSARAVKVFKYGLKMLRASKHVKILRWSLKRSTTKGHWHGRVWLEWNNDHHEGNIEGVDAFIPMQERIALQLALGDDPVRALMSWGRWRNGDPYPVLLIDHRKPGAVAGCTCPDTKHLPRCPCLRRLQSSEAEFLPRSQR